MESHDPKWCGIAALTAIACWLSGPATTTFAQEADAPGSNATGPATNPSREDWDLSDGLRLMRAVRDGVSSFDEPMFYWFCRFVREHAGAVAFRTDVPKEATPWQSLIDRPNDHRGQIITVEGVLQARPDFTVSGPGREGFGRLWQCELSQRGMPGLCAVIVTEGASQIPIRSRVRARGFFLKIRSYETQGGDVAVGPLLVAPRLDLIASPAADGRLVGAGSSSRIRWVLLAVALMAVLWLWLRRRTRKRSSGSRAFARRGGSGPIESDVDFKWLVDGQDPRKNNRD